MQTTGYIITSKNKPSAVIILKLTKTKYFGLFVPKYKELMGSKIRAIGSELSDSYVQGVLRDLPKSAEKVTVDIAADHGPLAQYKAGAIKTVFNTKKGPVGFTFVRGDRIPDFEGKPGEWLVIRRKNLLTESTEFKKNAW